jgi:hypothetical protein
MSASTMGIGSWPRRGLFLPPQTPSTVVHMANGGRLRDGETLGMFCMQGILGHGLESSEKGIHLLVGDGHAGVQQLHGLRVDGNQTRGLWILGRIHEAERGLPMRILTRRLEIIKATLVSSLGHLFRLNQSVPGGGGDQGDFGEEYTHSKPPGASCKSELLGRISRHEDCWHGF